MDDDPLYRQKLPIYLSFLCVAVTNSRRDADDVFAESDTDSRSDSEPGDNEDFDIRTPDTWPLTCVSGNEGLTGPTSRLPGSVGGAADGLVIQLDTTTKNNETETPSPTPAPQCDNAQNEETKTPPPAPAPPCNEVSKDTDGDPPVEVSALPPLQPIVTAQDRHATSVCLVQRTTTRTR